MARYIDADELKKQIDLVQILVMGGRSQGKSLLNETMETYKKAILKKIDEQPTADVVPKSEYEWVVSAVDNSTKEFLKLHDAYQEQKAEIERLEEELSKANADVKNYMKVAEYQQSLSVKRYHEIKRLKEDIERLEKTLDEYEETSGLKQAKTEVAREIFRELHREIEAALRSNYDALRVHDDGRINDYVLELVNRIKGKIDALRGIDNFLDELQDEKYT